MMCIDPIFQVLFGTVQYIYMPHKIPFELVRKAFVKNLECQTCILYYISIKRTKKGYS